MAREQRPVKSEAWPESRAPCSGFFCRGDACLALLGCAAAAVCGGQGGKCEISGEKSKMSARRHFK